MNQYKKLVSNTFIFAIGTFSAKALVFFMIPIYTRVLSSGEYGTVDLLVNTCNLLIPIVSAGIANAVTRFGLERSTNKKAVFSIGIVTNITGFALLPFLWPVLSHLNFAEGYTAYIYAYIVMSCLHAVCGQFTRALGFIRLYAADGLLRTVLTIGFNVLLMIVFPLGIAGYLMANILSDLLSMIFLVAAARLHRYFDLNAIDKKTFTSMFKYAIPLIPTTVSVWMINISGRYIITYFLGSEANGLYAVAYKIPTLLIIVSAIFMEAWQISAVGAQPKRAKEHFFSSVLLVYQSLIFITGSAIILLSKTIIVFLAAEAYWDAWQYVPVLTVSSGFMCFSAFLGSIYMVERKSVSTLITTFTGALVNMVLNFMLIPRLGLQGAAVSHLISYMVIFALRGLHTQKFLHIKWHLPRFFLNTLLLFTQCCIMLLEPEKWLFYEGMLFLSIVAINASALLTGAMKLRSR